MVKFLSKAEAKSWLAGKPKDPRGRRNNEFAIPVDAGRRVFLVGDLLSRFVGKEIVVVFSDWSVWPSGQRMHIFDRLRLSYGESGPLTETPIHVFETDQFEDAVSFVTLGVLFLFNVEVFAEDSVFFSHDEYGTASFNVGQWRR